MSQAEFMAKLDELNKGGKLTRVLIAHERPSTDQWEFTEYDPEAFDIEPNKLWAERVRQRIEACLETWRKYN